MPEDPERAYFTEIETEFIRRRGTPFLLSPKDYALARRWFALGIPAADVCTGIGDAFEGRAERGASGRVNSLGYCEGAVLDAWERRASARVGRPFAAAAPEMAAGLAALRETLERVDLRFAEPAAAARKALERLSASGKTPEEVERSLARIDKRLLREVEGVLSAEERERIRAEVDRRLGGDAAGMDERALRRTRDVLVRHRLRALFRLPRLSLLS
ncbi:MAG TPA: hypothetical protein VFL12_00835 [Thermoanaerobaculia bacterium]|nr:hypothetical protein [Thermoanaerobaculia bacterium]